VKINVTECAAADRLIVGERRLGREKRPPMEGGELGRQEERRWTAMGVLGPGGPQRKRPPLNVQSRRQAWYGRRDEEREKIGERQTREGDD